MNKYVLAGMALTLVLVVILMTQVSALKMQVEMLGEAQETTGNAVAAGNDNQPSAPSPDAPGNAVDMVALSDDHPVKGDPNAPVTIVEWSDFECLFCAKFYSQTLSQIEEEYINTGKVNLVYRNFPLSFHQNAQKAAEAAECADDQDMFWEMHDKLFEEGVSGGTAAFKQYAADIGLDTESFNSCLDSGEKALEVQQDMADGANAGIKGTPGFIINGQLISGAQPFANFKAVIDAALAG